MQAIRELLAQYQARKDDLARRPWYIAYSGGRDSLSLAHAQATLFEQGRLPCAPILLHVNHHLQPQSDQWALRAQEFAAEHRLSCHVLDVYPKNTETHARSARYAALFARMPKDAVLWLAHHADDQAETTLMRLLNGAGLSGLAAMPVWQTRPQKNIALFRPWLWLPRRAIDAYAAHHRLAYIDDPTNDTGDNARSVIRRELLPLLQKLNPQAQANIARSARALDDDRIVIDAQSQSELLAIQTPTLSFGDIQKALSVPDLTTRDAAMQRTILRRFAKGDCAYGIDFALTRRLWELCQRQDGDHKSLHYWQSDPCQNDPRRAYVFCRYRDTLYRYRFDFWQSLASDAPVWRRQSDDCWTLDLGSWRFLLRANQIASVRPLGRGDKVAYRRRLLSGKKLHQTLGAPPWLRDRLWLLERQNASPVVLSVGRVWSLGDKDDCPPLYNFAGER